MIIAVYGSLLTGLGNHHILGSSKLIDIDTVKGFDMFSLGPFPGILEGEGEVKVELYEVDDEILTALDRLEGHPRFYKRTEVVTSAGVNASIYVLQQRAGQNMKHIKNGDWMDYLESNKKVLKRQYGSGIFYDPKR